MDIIIVMCMGILVGKFLLPAKAKKRIEYLSLTCTFLLIFSMGVMLGKKEHFLEELSTLGICSFLFFIIPTILSILFVYLLTQHFMKNKHTKSDRKDSER